MDIDAAIRMKPPQRIDATRAPSVDDDAAQRDFESELDTVTRQEPCTDKPTATGKCHPADRPDTETQSQPKTDPSPDPANAAELVDSMVQVAQISLAAAITAGLDNGQTAPAPSAEIKPASPASIATTAAKPNASTASALFTAAANQAQPGVTPIASEGGQVATNAAGDTGAVTAASSAGERIDAAPPNAQSQPALTAALSAEAAPAAKPVNSAKKTATQHAPATAPNNPQTQAVASSTVTHAAAPAAYWDLEK